jgi:hypothetical protein
MIAKASSPISHRRTQWKIAVGIIGMLWVATPTAVALAQSQATACALIN